MNKYMSRRHFIKTGAFSLGTLSLGTRLSASPLQTEHDTPNILFILTDDQRWDAMGCAGNPIIQTPHMDELGQMGTRFEHAFVTSPVSAASRASIFSSLHERSHGFTFGTPPLADPYTRMSYPSLLKQAGYRTGFVGKFGIQVHQGAKKDMFDYFKSLDRNPYFKKVAGKQKHLTDVTADHAIQFIRNNNRDKPFCLSISFNAPHAEDKDPNQYYWPESCDHLYNDVKIPEPVLSSPSFFKSQPSFLQNSLNRVRWKWRFDTPDKYQAMVKGYYRMISGVDQAIGKIREELKKLGLDKNTIIIFMSDNGYFLGERGFAGKWLMHDLSIRVPLIIFDPRKSTQRIEPRQMVSNLDIAPTILDMAGVQIPHFWQGKSLLPLLQDPLVNWRTELFCEHLYNHEQIPQSEAIRTDRWKYIRYPKHPERRRVV